MEIRFSPTEEDALNAMRASSMPRWVLFLFVLFLALLFLVGIFLIDHGFPLAGWLWLAMSASIGIAVYEVPRIQVRRSLRSNPSAQGEIVYLFDDGLSHNLRDWRIAVGLGSLYQIQGDRGVVSIVFLAVSLHIDPKASDVARAD